MDLVITDQRRGDISVISLEGDLDVMSAPALRGALDRHIRAGHLRIVLDLNQVSFMDSAALGVIVGRTRLAQMASGSVRLVCTVPRIIRLFSITGLDRILPLHESVDEAVSLCAADASTT